LVKRVCVDFVISVFQLINRRGYFVPAFNLAYGEKGTDAEWRISCGGTRAYLVRFATPLDRDIDEQAADSHFMVRRVTASLLMSGIGLFQAIPVGRVLFTDVWGDAVGWIAQCDHPDPELTEMPVADTDVLYGWIRALCLHTFLRRAAEDAHTALLNPLEALVFVYRGLEWLVEGIGFTWDDIAKELGGTRNDIRELKKSANFETGVRHASKSGLKMRPDLRNYGSYVAGLFDIINAARAKVEPGYMTVAGKEGGKILPRAVPYVPFE
jgi:hypothetical protein